MTSRTNEQWLQALKEPGEQQIEAIEALRDYLMRAILVYLHKHRGDLTYWSSSDIHQFAEDMSQDALLAIRQKLETFRGDSKFTTWAYRFAINITAGELRRSRYRDLSLEGVQEQEALILADIFRDTQNVGPGVATERQAFVDLLGSIIREELTERQRLAILAVHFQDLFTSTAIGAIHLYLAIDTTGAQERLIEHFGSVRGRHDDDPGVRSKPIHFDQECVKRLFAFVMPTHDARSASLP